jgi:MFS family permease
VSASASKPNAAHKPVAAPEVGAPSTVASREPVSPNGAPAETANPPNYRWNFSVLALDAALFSVAMSFVGTTTVFPSLLVRLNASEVLVGAASGLMSGAWLLPQLFVAGAVARMPYKKPIITWGAWLSRPLFAVMALVIWLYAVSRPSLTLAIVLVCFTIFWVMDAVVSIPWYEIIGKTIPPRRRGRMLGLSQVLGAVGGIGAGIVVRYILSENSRWAFPGNYAILFICACVAFLIAATMLTIIREPASTSLAKERPTTRQVLALLPRILLDDRPFRRMIMVRLCAGFVSMANAFYVLYATRELGFSVETTGLFISAQVAGSLTAGLVTSTVLDRHGPLAHARTMICIAVLPPLLGLAMGPLYALLGPATLYPYLVLYFFLGLYLSSLSYPFFNYILEYVGEGRQALYIGMNNTINALTMLAPALGGLLVKSVSYQAVFATAIVFAVLAFLLALGLPSTRGAEGVRP